MGARMIQLPTPDAIGWAFAAGGAVLYTVGALFLVGWLLRRAINFFYDSVTWRLGR